MKGCILLLPSQALVSAKLALKHGLTIIDHLSNVVLHLKLLNQINSTHSRSVSIAILTSLSDRVFPDLAKTTTLKITAAQKQKLTEALTELLFQPRYNGFPEDGRLQRAKAISALANAEPAFRQVAKEAIMGEGRLAGVVELERITRIRDILLAARARLE